MIYLEIGIKKLKHPHILKHCLHFPILNPLMFADEAISFVIKMTLSWNACKKEFISHSKQIRH